MSRWMKKGLLTLGRVKELLKITDNDSVDLAKKNIRIASTPEQANRYYTAQAQELFKHGRYEAIRKLGTGRYSNVWLAKDLQQNSYVALKLLTSDCYGQGHDIFEIEILATIAQQQQQQQQLLSGAEASHTIGLLDSFRLHGPAGEHRCIVMPVLGSTLGRQAHRFPDRRIPVNITKNIVKQLLTGLAFLHDSCKVIHTDLQPANICVEIGLTEVERKSSQQDSNQELTVIAGIVSGESADSVTPTIDETARVRIVDFGVASWIDKHLSNHIQPEHLRAPEVILGAPWGPPVDIWSLGCLVIEFVKGHLAFPGEASPHGSWNSEEDHLAQYMEVLGPMPPELLKRGFKTNDFFDDKGVLLRIPELQITTLEKRIDGNEFPFKRPADMQKEEVPAFLAFLRGALALDPQNRSTAKQLLQHEWLSA